MRAVRLTLQEDAYVRAMRLRPGRISCTIAVR